jgi:hypothetical protein
MEPGADRLALASTLAFEVIVVGIAVIHPFG